MAKEISLFDVIEGEIEILQSWDFLETEFLGKELSYAESIDVFIREYEKTEKLIEACKKIYPNAIRFKCSYDHIYENKDYDQILNDIEDYKEKSCEDNLPFPEDTKENK